MRPERRCLRVVLGGDWDKSRCQTALLARWIRPFFQRTRTGLQNMSTPGSPFASLVHTYDIEVQEFSWYALVIDVRSAAEFAEDHIPGATHLPLSETDRAAQQTPGELVAAEAAPLPYRLAGLVANLKPGDPVLVYCASGSRDSLVWARPLKSAGFRVDVLAGGWGNYRRWVSEGIRRIGSVIEARAIAGSPGTGLCRAVYELRQRGEQVLDLAVLAGQEFLPGLAWPCDLVPSQAAFETQVLQALRALDGSRPVWVRVACLGVLSVGSIERAWQRGPIRVLRLDAAARAENWLRRLDAMQVSAEQLLRMIVDWTGRPAGEVSSWWSAAIVRGGLLAGLTEVLERVVDPQVMAVEGDTEDVRLADASVETVGAAVSAWLGT